MKIVLKNGRRLAMTRVEALIVICVALIGIYLFVRYQKTGEIFQVSWRKAAGKSTAATEIASTETGSVMATNADDETKTYAVTTRSFSTNPGKKPGNEDSSSEIVGMRLSDPRKQRVRVPTNAVWFSTRPRRGPGVRIAFP